MYLACNQIYSVALKTPAALSRVSYRTHSGVGRDYTSCVQRKKKKPNRRNPPKEMPPYIQEPPMLIALHSGLLIVGIEHAPSGWSGWRWLTYTVRQYRYQISSCSCHQVISAAPSWERVFDANFGAERSYRVTLCSRSGS